MGAAAGPIAFYVRGRVCAWVNYYVIVLGRSERGQSGVLFVQFHQGLLGVFHSKYLGEYLARRLPVSWLFSLTIVYTLFKSPCFFSLIFSSRSLCSRRA